LIGITEETGYPFSDRVRFTIHCEQPVSFPLHFRIPAWANQAVLSVSGEPNPRHPTKGTLFKVERVLEIRRRGHLELQFQSPHRDPENNAVAIAWGPLYFVLRIGEEFQKDPSACRFAPSSTGPRSGRVRQLAHRPNDRLELPLAIDRNNPQCIMTTNKISSMPFAQKGGTCEVGWRK